MGIKWLFLISHLVELEDIIIQNFKNKIYVKSIIKQLIMSVIRKY